MTFGGISNYICEVAGYFYANTSGSYTFGVNSDDNSDLFIDGKLVADWFTVGGHGTNSSGTPGGNQRSIYLNQGFHRLYGRWQQGSGSDAYEIVFKNPGDSAYTIVPIGQLSHHPTDFILSANDNIYLTQITQVANTTASTSNTTGALTVSGGIGVSGNVYANAVFTKGLFLASNGAVISTGGGGGVSASGYLANSVVFANSTGYLSNTSNLQFNASNNALSAGGTIATGGVFLNSNTITSNTVIPPGYNGFAVGPIIVANNVTLTVSSNSRWLLL
jgi:hypothetical protein